MATDSTISTCRGEDDEVADTLEHVVTEESTHVATQGRPRSGRGWKHVKPPKEETNTGIKGGS